jgi:hypothetical protein
LRLTGTYGAGSAALYSLISEDEATEQLALVEEAFRVLNDDVMRRDYDEKIGVARPRQGAAAVACFEPVADNGGLHTDRLLLTREQMDTSRIRTHRSTLPITKLKANRAGSEDMKAKLAAMAEGADPGDGDLFKRLREACEVTEDEICERTKVSITYIRAIESNRFDRLPQCVYVKGFLRSYFRYLQMPDAEKLVAGFSARLMDWQANRKA